MSQVVCCHQECGSTPEQAGIGSIKPYDGGEKPQVGLCEPAGGPAAAAKAAGQQQQQGYTSHPGCTTAASRSQMYTSSGSSCSSNRSKSSCSSNKGTEEDMPRSSCGSSAPGPCKSRKAVANTFADVSLTSAAATQTLYRTSAERNTHCRQGSTSSSSSSSPVTKEEPRLPQLLVQRRHEAMHLTDRRIISRLAGGESSTVHAVVDAAVHLRCSSKQSRQPLQQRQTCVAASNNTRP